ncbi:XRE family transcriptional regulator [Kribbella jiaozuonensis]|nr:XRE family transcriptional regulator [Kribbella jiaozuonensis]
MGDQIHGAWRGERFTVLRDLHGLTQTDLADVLGVTQGFVSQLEKGQKAIPDHVVAEAAARYRLPLSFFSVGPGPTDWGVHTFRKKARASARDERRVKALFDEAARTFFEVSKASGFWPVDLPDPGKFDHDPEEVAEELRSVAGLRPEDPVRNLTRLIERRGVGVITHLDSSESDVTLDGHFGISRPAGHNDRPIIATARPLPGAVQRLTLGHELGHILFDKELTRALKSTRAPEEQRAYRFAGALLLPERVARKRITNTLSLHGYLRIKADYGVSVGAIIRRGWELGILSDDRYRSLNIQLSSQGWRTDEPVEVARENPQLYSQTLQRAVGSDWRAAINEYGQDPVNLRRWLPDTEAQQGPTRDAKVLQLRRRPESTP